MIASAARTQAARLAVLVSLATGALAAALAERHFLVAVAAGSALHVGATAVAAFRPKTARTATLLGVAVAWPVALGAGGALAAVPIVLGVVLGAELLGTAAEHAVVVDHPTEPALRRAVAVALLAGAAALVVAIAAAGPSVGGTTAAALGTAAVALAAAGLARATTTPVGPTPRR